MAERWSRLECELIVEDYLSMMEAHFRQERYNKAEHNRNLRTKLKGRSRPSVEFKHRNISAVLLRSGRAYIPGYKPAWNYQELLETVVLDRLASEDRDILQIETVLIDQVPGIRNVDSTKTILVEPPERVPERRVRESSARIPRKINYTERELRNRTLGEKGEEFVIDFEKKRLAELGRDDLIDDVEWTSKEKGDGTGYDVRSFQSGTDEPLYIEVKTTNSGKYQPFMVSTNEVAFSDEFQEQFSLYRVFEFARSPKLFTLHGHIKDHVDLTPTTFRANF